MTLDFYKQPFRLDENSDWVYDANGNFVFQFELFENTRLNNQIMEIINDKSISKTNMFTADFETQEIYVSDVDGIDQHCITIRGWGNLTGTGAHNLPLERAIKIQDDFMRWLLFKLNK